MTFELTRSATCSHRLALFVWYGMLVMTMASRGVFEPFARSIVASPRRVTAPLPVRYISRNPPGGAMISPPVGKSGAGMCASRSSSVHPSGSDAYAASAAATSRRL